VEEMAKCKFCAEARQSLDAVVESALASIDTSLDALANLERSMADAKWGRRLTPNRQPGDEDRRHKVRRST
jgi:hypothetical protein